MKNSIRPIVFGEVLFDCFPDGQQVLGGAPFNVAWHLQAFGDQPCFVSRVGKDELGNRILDSMKNWGMDTAFMQTDSLHQTGRVDVTLIDNEPKYDITPDCAYDFIDETLIENPEGSTILYHGTLGLRNESARRAFDKLAKNPDMSIFMDVNLRSPWWQKIEVINWLKRARWAKLNHQELCYLGPDSGDMRQDMLQFQAAHDLELLIVTVGEKGAMVRNRDGDVYSMQPQTSQNFVDSVGAGDAFTAVFLHGLMARWPLLDTLKAAQQFATAVVGLRGATSVDPGFYKQFSPVLRNQDFGV